jgi:putative transposase
MIKTYKVQLKPNQVQHSLLNQAAGTSRWAYNWGLAKSIEHYNETGKFLLDGDLRKELTQLKQTSEYEWLYKYSNNITKQALKDMSQAFKNFFKKNAQFPKFKSKRKSKASFYHDPLKLKLTDTHVRLEKIGKVRLVEKGRIPTDGKFLNPRIGQENGKWYLSIGVEFEPDIGNDVSEPIGIDLGIKDLAIISDGRKYKNINKSKRVKQLEKRKKRLQRRASRHYERMVKDRCKKSQRLLKLEADIRSANKKICDQHTNHIHQMTSELVKAKPAYIVIEDLNVNGMLKNHKLAKAIQDNRLAEVRRQLEYKCEWYGVELVIADRFYPSSKLCSQCGHKKEQLKLSERVYHCEHCGMEMDRDLNATINLLHYKMYELSA